MVLVAPSLSSSHDVVGNAMEMMRLWGVIDCWSPWRRQTAVLNRVLVVLVLMIFVRERKNRLRLTERRGVHSCLCS